MKVSPRIPAGGEGSLAVRSAWCSLLRALRDGTRLQKGGVQGQHRVSILLRGVVSECLLSAGFPFGVMTMCCS